VKLFPIKLLVVLVQLECREVKNHEIIENKGEYGDLSQIKRMKNCVIHDTMAQFKMKWRRLYGTKFTGD